MNVWLWWVVMTVVLAAAVAVAGYAVVRRKQMHLWLWSYLRQRRPVVPDGPVHVMFCFVDHYEPQWGRPPYETEVARVRAWTERYPEMARRHRDADGVHPQHTFFYPEEEYRPEHLAALADLCAQGFGEIEVHLHHDHDTADGLREKLHRFVRVLHEDHGALPVDPATGKPVFAFIHGNWCLDNSRPDGRWCGVNDELQVLAECGCYADYTMPSAPSDTQTSKINAIYYAIDDPVSPKSHDEGVDAAVGEPPVGDLLLVQGPLALNWKQAKWGVLPRIENADVRTGQEPTPDRVDLWVQQHIHVRGRPDWVFVKVHTHGAPERDQDTLLGEAVHRMHDYLDSRYNDGTRHVLHYVTARELYNIVKAAEDGRTGNPHQYRDYVLAPPRLRASASGPV